MKLNQIGRLLACLGMVVVVGCVAERESLHELDHQEPAHWPKSMEEAAEFIASRVQVLAPHTQADDAQARQAISQLRDLVEWSPELAADTDMSEADWLPIYELSEAIRTHMQSSDVDLIEFADDFDKLCQLLRTAHVDATGN